MNIAKEEWARARRILKSQMPYSRIVEALEVILQDARMEGRDSIDIQDMGHFLSAITWDRSDVASVLRALGQRGIKPNVDAVLKELDMADTEAFAKSSGTDDIQAAAERAMEAGALILPSKFEVLGGTVGYRTDISMLPVRHLLFPGGYGFKDKDGNSYMFDFMVSEGGVDIRGDGTRANFRLSFVNEESAAVLDALCGAFPDIVKMTKCSLDSEEGEGCPKVVEATDFSLIIKDRSGSLEFTDTPYWTFETGGEGPGRLITATATSRLLQTLEPET